MINEKIEDTNKEEMLRKENEERIQTALKEKVEFSKANKEKEYK